MKVIGDSVEVTVKAFNENFYQLIKPSRLIRDYQALDYHIDGQSIHQ